MKLAIVVCVLASTVMGGCGTTNDSVKTQEVIENSPELVVSGTDAQLTDEEIKEALKTDKELVEQLEWLPIQKYNDLKIGKDIDFMAVDHLRGKAEDIKPNDTLQSMILDYKLQYTKDTADMVGKILEKNYKDASDLDANEKLGFFVNEYWQLLPGDKVFDDYDENSVGYVNNEITAAQFYTMLYRATTPVDETIFDRYTLTDSTSGFYDFVKHTTGVEGKEDNKYGTPIDIYVYNIYLSMPVERYKAMMADGAYETYSMTIGDALKDLCEENINYFRIPQNKLKQFETAEETYDYLVKMGVLSENDTLINKETLGNKLTVASAGDLLFNVYTELENYNDKVARDRKIEDEKIKAVEKGTYADCNGSDVTEEGYSEDELNAMVSEEDTEQSSKKTEQRQSNQSSESSSSKNSNESQTNSNNNTANNNDTQKGDGDRTRNTVDLDDAASAFFGSSKPGATQEEINEHTRKNGGIKVE